MPSNKEILSSTIVNPRNQREYDRLMAYLDEQGYVWSTSTKASAVNYFRDETFCVRIPPGTQKTLYFDRIGSYSQKGYKILSVNDYMREPTLKSTPNLNSKLIQAIKGCVG